MTDSQMAHATYIEPLTVEAVEKVIAKERPDAILPTMGGQTGLNLAIKMAEDGILDRYGVELLGVKPEAIAMAEDRELFKKAIEEIGLEVCASAYVSSEEEAIAFAAKVGYPVIVRPSFTLGGTGGGIAYNVEELQRAVHFRFRSKPRASAVNRGICFRLEGNRGRGDEGQRRQLYRGLHHRKLRSHGHPHGDSITVAPAQTLTAKEYNVLQKHRTRSLRKSASSLVAATCSML